MACTALILNVNLFAVCAPETIDLKHIKFDNDRVVLEGGTTPIAPYLDIKGLTRMAAERGFDLVHSSKCVCGAHVRTMRE